MTRRDLERALRALGWVLWRHGSRQDVWTDGERRLVVPRHGEINERTALAILQEARR